MALKIIKLIETDHETVRDLMKKILESSSGAIKTREQNFTKFKKEVLEHLHAEENVFYPYLLQKTEDKEIIYEAFEEHRVVRLALPDLDSTDIDDERWKPKFKVVSEVISHHLEEEEDQVFDEAEEIIDDESDSQLAQNFKTAKQEAHIKI